MKILLNFLPLKSGGGVQVGLDFLHQLAQFGTQHEWFLVASEGTPFVTMAQSDILRMAAVVPRNTAHRLLFEYSQCRQLVQSLKPDVIYTQFGPQWPGAARELNVVGCAYSNLLYPEVPFWERLPFKQRVLREIVDAFRKRRLRQADFAIFETRDLAERCVRLGIKPQDKVATVMPSASSLVSPGQSHDSVRARAERMPIGFRILLLSVFNPNKNIDFLNDIALELNKRHGNLAVKFIITLPEKSSETEKIMDRARSLGVEDMLFNIGPIPHEGCAELYSHSDSVILPAQLESFSNSIGEAWKMGLPLIISDMPWARSICGEAACYIKYRDREDAAQAIIKLVTSDDYRRALVRAGHSRLDELPSPKNRFLAYLNILEDQVRRRENSGPVRCI